MEFEKIDKILDKIIFALKNISPDYDICMTFHINEENELEILVEKE